MNFPAFAEGIGPQKSHEEVKGCNREPEL